MATTAPTLVQRLKGGLQRITSGIRTLPYRGDARFCPVCDRPSARFRAFGQPPREDAQCVRCGALERHRLLWLFLQQRTDLFDGRPKRMLHVAPEPCLEARLRQRIGTGYRTADLLDPRADERMDIMEILHPEATFDVIYCGHVLEHVPDDRRALREFRRVLKPGGWAILLVPIVREQTFEDASITDPRGRLEAFGQEDHVRVYGKDYPDRLREAGFDVSVTRPDDLVDGAGIARMGLTPPSGEIHYCTPAAR